MTTPLSFDGPVHFGRGPAGRKSLEGGPAPPVPPPRVPRVARLMALALKLDGLIRSGVLRDHAEAARLGRVTRARVTQVMNLIHLAPDLQEALLFLPPVTAGPRPARPARTSSR